eukprot:CAMPEP_0184643840 /NCGR_PEP_ID=MMETSP0308-20130426/662_1 /TAXON_ID=38269 /ORGANISM="Gloeochaete witrockiana, Strain SAG 46.84" /LENGTH=168 /DNA_ID=CAMNT_0027072049 /DNA_START=401 /DNA_END=903 /DNA_ORIENTATION=-
MAAAAEAFGLGDATLAGFAASAFGFGFGASFGFGTSAFVFFTSSSTCLEGFTSTTLSAGRDEMRAEDDKGLNVDEEVPVSCLPRSDCNKARCARLTRKLTNPTTPIVIVAPLNKANANFCASVIPSRDTDMRRLVTANHRKKSCHIRLSLVDVNNNNTCPFQKLAKNR